MSKLIDITGQRFGRLTVIKRSDNKKGRTAWKCRCECGNESIVLGENLKRGTSKSCGCLAKELRGKTHKKHGMTGRKIHNIWMGMKQRCYNKNNEKYKNYGARGIIVCKEWLDDFMNFYNWAIENGFEDPSDLTLDRKNVNGNYEPSNCRWVDMKTQQNNKTVNLNVTIGGVTKTAKQWQEEFNLTHGTIRRRLDLGWDEKDLLKPSTRKSADKQSGVRGVTWYKPDGIWVVRLSVEGKMKKIGSSRDLKKAIQIKEDHINKLNENNE